MVGAIYARKSTDQSGVVDDQKSSRVRELANHCAEAER
jgi:hypothetical protein